jgi:hypothetical protein
MCVGLRSRIVKPTMTEETLQAIHGELLDGISNDA